MQEFVLIVGIIFLGYLFFSWEEIPIGYRGVLKLLGVQLPLTLSEGLKFIPFRGLLKVSLIDARMKAIKFSVNYLWSRSNHDPNKHLKVGERLHIQGNVFLNYRIDNPVFLEMGGETELISLLDQLVVSTFQKEIIRGNLTGLLTDRGRKRIFEEINPLIVSIASSMGVSVKDVVLQSRVVDLEPRSRRFRRF